MIRKAKNAIKSDLMRRLHAREEIVSRIATRVAHRGVERSWNWSFENDRTDILGYLESLRTGEFDYRFSRSVGTPTIYGSVYAFLIRSMFDGFESMQQMNSWIDHFDAAQSEDGLFRDPALAGESFEHRGGWGEGWGVRHLVAHLIIPYARAGRRPKHAFRFLEPFFDPAELDRWLSGFDFAGRLWSQSNYIMNLYTVLQFARDHMDEPRAGAAVLRIAAWLRDHQNPETGLWHDSPLTTRANMNDAVRGAYHYYPLFEYDRLPVAHQKAAIDVILRTQNAWGAFEEEDRPAGACEDIDALDPLLRFARRTGHRSDDVNLAAYRAFVWLLACRNDDGGSSSLPEHACHYGGHPLTTSTPGESNLFATWFRTLTMAHVTRFLGKMEAYSIGHYPGYEMSLPAASQTIQTKTAGKKA